MFRLEPGPPAEVPRGAADFGGLVVDALRSVLGPDFVGAYFVGSLALGGYVAGESDMDIAAVCQEAVPEATKASLAAALTAATPRCPARGLEFSLYRREIAATASSDAAFEVNVNGGPRMETKARLSAEGQPGFWYAIDRAVAHRRGVVIAGPPANQAFADLPRGLLLTAMVDSMRWHRSHERATLYSVLNAARAWRFAKEDVLGSKLEGADWARSRWKHPSVIDAALALRYGKTASLEDAAVDALLEHVEEALTRARDDQP